MTVDRAIEEYSRRGGVPAELTQLDASRGEVAHRHPYFLPDGRHFLFTIVSQEPESSGIYVGSLDSSERKRIVSSGLKAGFSPPDHLLFVLHDPVEFQIAIAVGGSPGPAGTLMVQQFDPSSFELSGDPFPIAEVSGNFGNSAAGFASSDNGVLAYRVVDPNRTMHWYDRTGKNLGTVDPPAPWESPLVSPDLQRIAVGRRDVGDLWILDQARGANTRLTFDPAFEHAPVWSPDGARIVFSSSRGGAMNLYQKNSTGIGPDEILLESDHEKLPEDWSLDGRFILYRERGPKTDWDLWALPLTGDRRPEPVIATSFGERQGRFSPDGRWIAYSSDESGADQVYVQTFPPSGGKWQISASGGLQPRWRRDGQELFFMTGFTTSAPSDVMAVDVDTSDTGVSRAGVPRKLFTVVASAGNVRNNWDVTPDGQRFLVVSVSSATAPPVTVVVNWSEELKQRAPTR